MTDRKPLALKVFSYLLVHVNVQSLSNKVGIIDVFNSRFRPDFLCLTEHWLDENSSDSILMSGYKLISRFCRTEHIRGGAAIFGSAQIASRCRTCTYVNSMAAEFHFECCSLILDGQLCVVCIYRSNNVLLSNYNVFLSRFEQLLRFCCSTFRYLIITGDLNVDKLSTNGVDAVARKRYVALKDLSESFQLRCLVEEPTRYDGRTGRESCLDYLITNLVDCEHDVFNMGVSDHAAQRLAWSVDDCEDAPAAPSYSFRNFRDVDNLAQFKTILSSMNVCLGSVPVDESFGGFCGEFLGAVDRCFPNVTGKSRQVKPGDRIIFSEQLYRDLERLRFLNFVRKTVESDSLNTQYRDLKRSLDLKIQYEKRAFFSKQILKSKNISKTLWAFVNQNKSLEKRGTISLESGGRIVDDPTAVANEFGRYFSSVVDISLRAHFQGKRLPCTVSKTTNPYSMYLGSITAEDILTAINALSRRDSVSIDGVPLSLIRECLDVLMPTLVSLVNDSFDQGEFPDILKLSKLVPVPKKGKLTKAENYRPICVVSSFSRIIEKVAYVKLNGFLTRFGVLSASQHGFRSGLSTETALISFAQYVTDLIDQRKYTVGVFLDFSRAFDTLDPQFLSAKLDSLGVRGVANRWFVSFVTNRKFKVKVDGCVSETFSTRLGTPQGSILGPLLFLIYINDLPDYINGKVFIYADDTAIVLAGTSPEEIQDLLDGVFEQVDDWCARNQVILNFKKTVCVEFRSIFSSAPLSITYSHRGALISTSDRASFLGVAFDTFLDFSLHIDSLCNRLNKLTYLFFSLRSSLPLGLLLNVYHGLVHSVLSYSIVIWGHSAEAQRVFVAQKRILRAIFGLRPLDSCRQVFRDNKILTVFCTYAFKLLVHIFDHRGNLETVSQKHSYSTRQKDDIYLSSFNYMRYKKSPTYAGCTYYNMLPNNIKQCCTRNSFKAALKSFLVSKAFYDRSELVSCLTGAQ